MEIIVKNANYKGLGFGNTRWVENLIENNGIVIPAHQTAWRSYYSDLTSIGLDRKFTGIYVPLFRSAAKNKLNILRPFDQDGTYRLTFVNDHVDAHAANGFVPLPGATLAASRYIRTEFNLTDLSQLTNFHFHVYNAAADSAARYLGGTFGNTNGTSIFIGLARNSGGLTKGGITTHNSLPPQLQSAAGYDVARASVLSIIKNGSSQKLLDDGVVLDSKTMTPALTLGATPQPLYFGSANQSETTVSTAPLAVCAFGTSPITDAETLFFAQKSKALVAALLAA